MQAVHSEFNVNSSYVIFDGLCGFCNQQAMWIAKHDVHRHFTLVSNVSAFGVQLLTEFGLEGKTSTTLILIGPNRAVSFKSLAIQKIVSRIPGFRFLKFIMRIVPRSIQNGMYDLISKCRKIIPIRMHCGLVDEDLRKHFRS